MWRCSSLVDDSTYLSPFFFVFEVMEGDSSTYHVEVWSIKHKSKHHHQRLKWKLKWTTKTQTHLALKQQQGSNIWPLLHPSIKPKFNRKRKKKKGIITVRMWNRPLWSNNKIKIVVFCLIMWNEIKWYVNWYVLLIDWRFWKTESFEFEYLNLN